MNKRKKMNTSCQDCQTRTKGIFSQCEPDALDILDQRKIVNTYQKGQTLFVEGNPTHGLFCVKWGAVKLTKMGIDGKDVIVRLVGTGGVLGHRSVFSANHYGASATALEETKVCFIEKKLITELIEKDSSVAYSIIGHLSLELGASEKKQASFSQKNVEGRVCELLFILKQSYGEKLDDNLIRINLKLSREDMASYLGIATETLIRTISELKKERIINQDGKNIIILDENKLIKWGKIDC